MFTKEMMVQGPRSCLAQVVSAFKLRLNLMEPQCPGLMSLLCQLTLRDPGQVINLSEQQFLHINQGTDDDLM